MKFSNLFQPINIGKVTIKNRFAMAPLFLFGNPLYSPELKSMTKDAIEYYSERAKGGVGLIITGGFKAPHKADQPVIPEVTPQGLHAFGELADICHGNDCKVFVQVTCGIGRNVMPSQLAMGIKPVCASDIPSVFNPRIMCRGLTREEIKEIEDSHKLTAELLHIAGIDGIEVHGHEGYLLDSFTSPIFNKRTDEYGGSLENRLRLPINLLNGIKDAAGKDYPVTYRFGVKHFVKDLRVGALRAEGFEEKGRDVNESHEIMKLLEKEGYDGFHLDAGCYDSWFWSHPPIYMGHGPHLDLMKGITEVVKVPIITANRLGLPEVAEKVIKDKLAHIVAIGRALLADPEFPNKLEKGDVEDIRPCTGCQDACMDLVFDHGRGLSCSVNPRCGREIHTRLYPVVKPRNIIVIGGGPAGMELARVATIRGHKVKLYEKEESLGGHLKEGSIPDFKFDYKRLLDWYITQMKRLNVDVRVNNELKSSNISEIEGADAVVLATGSTSITPEIPGVKKRNVVNCGDVLLGKANVGDDVVVIGGSLEGCETAYWLANQGKNVTLLERLSDLMTVHPVFYTNRNYLIGLLGEANVFVMTNINVEKISEEGVTITQTIAMDRTENQDIYCPGKQRTIPCDTIVLAVGFKSNDQLYQSLKGRVKELHTIGDCQNPGKIHDAIWDGFTLGRNL